MIKTSFDLWTDEERFVLRALLTIALAAQGAPVNATLKPEEAQSLPMGDLAAKVLGEVGSTATSRSALAVATP